MLSPSEWERLLEDNREQREELRRLREKLAQTKREIELLKYKAGKPWGVSK